MRIARTGQVRFRPVFSRVFRHREPGVSRDFSEHVFLRVGAALLGVLMRSALGEGSGHTFLRAAGLIPMSSTGTRRVRLVTRFASWTGRLLRRLGPDDCRQHESGQNP